jgi:predicted amino acid-binding ACT domain protein
MALWTFRVELPDRPGRLAALTGAVADCGGNILALDVQALDGTRVADELLVDLPDDVAVEDVEAQIKATGADVVMLAAASTEDLVDPQTRCLELGRRLVRRHTARERVLEAALAELVGADGAMVVPATTALTSALALQAIAEGKPMMARERTGLSPAMVDEEPPWLLVIPPSDGAGGQLTMLARNGAGFSAGEIGRVEALLGLAAELAAYADDQAISQSAASPGAA